MREYQDLEILEIETLELLNSIKVLENLYFGGETMLRLCHNLNRYSTDLDFWLNPNSDHKKIFEKISAKLDKNYQLIDAANKRYSLVFQFKSPNVNRSLKIEIRKQKSDFDWELKIAFSKFTNKQVQVKGLTLEQMMRNKVEALISRKIIRDCFDIEFLIKRGINLPPDKSKLLEIQKIISAFKEREFKVNLGSVLEAKDREFYLQNRFQLLKEEIQNSLNSFNSIRGN